MLPLNYNFIWYFFASLLSLLFSSFGNRFYVGSLLLLSWRKKKKRNNNNIVVQKVTICDSSFFCFFAYSYLYRSSAKDISWWITKCHHLYTPFFYNLSLFYLGGTIVVQKVTICDSNFLCFFAYSYLYRSSVKYICLWIKKRHLLYNYISFLFPFCWEGKERNFSKVQKVTFEIHLLILPFNLFPEIKRKQKG